MEKIIRSMSKIYNIKNFYIGIWKESLLMFNIVKVFLLLVYNIIIFIYWIYVSIFVFG